MTIGIGGGWGGCGFLRTVITRIFRSPRVSYPFSAAPELNTWNALRRTTGSAVVTVMGPFRTGSSLTAETPLEHFSMMLSMWAGLLS